MREIKFRALVVQSRLDNLGPRMHMAGVSEYERIIDVVDISFSGGEIDYVTDEEGDEYSYADDSLKSIIQFTGLKDKNGQEIYEGDIIECNYMGFQKWKATVKFGEYEQDGSGGEYSPTECVGFYADAIDKDQTDEFDCKFIIDYLETVSLLDFKDIEVIGNIYKNPDLLD